MSATKQNRTGRVIASAAAAAIGVLLIVFGALLLGANSTRDAGGFLSSGTTNYTASGYALTTKSYRAGSLGSVGVPPALLGDVRVQVRSDKRVFVGIARSEDVEDYMRGVSHTAVTGVDHGEDHDSRGAGVTPGNPAAEGFWVASTSGRGPQTLKWHARSGHWRAVVMNADDSRGVRAGMSLGAEIPHLERAGVVSLAVGLVLAAAAALALRFGARRG